MKLKKPMFKKFTENQDIHINKTNYFLLWKYKLDLKNDGGLYGYHLFTSYILFSLSLFISYKK